MDQIWVPIAIALFGNAVAVLIVLLTNRDAVKREEARQAHEAKRWAREDAWKVGEVQRGYYVAFYGELRTAAVAIHNAGYGIGKPLTFGWQEPSYNALQTLRVFASPGTLEYAEAAYSALYRWGDADPVDYETREEVEFDSRLSEFLEAVRTDVGMVGQPIGQPSSRVANPRRTAPPKCPRCGVEMIPVPGKPGLFECPACEMSRAIG